MSSLLILSAVLITLALVFYSIGIWAERIARLLKPWHLIMFWLGFTFDISGTAAMHLLASGPFDIFEPHTLSGQTALWLMLFHAIWATYTIRKGEDDLKKKFHKFSFLVWIIWLIPYFSGMYLGMNN